MFEELVYYREYYIDSKFIGKINCVKDRETIGYDGREFEITNTEITLENNKKIKKGVNVMTILYPLCGKDIK